MIEDHLVLWVTYLLEVMLLISQNLPHKMIYMLSILISALMTSSSVTIYMTSYCNHVKNILVPTVHYPCRFTPYVQESKKLQVLIINKDERKLLACNNGNEDPIWIWNDS